MISLIDQVNKTRGKNVTDETLKKGEGQNLKMKTEE